MIVVKGKEREMKIQRYKMGVMDIYPILANRTEIENTPLLQVTLKEMVDAEKLYQAVLLAVKRYPLFQCRICAKKEIYLETNPNKITLLHTPIEERPMTFGKLTQEYPWRICYFEKDIVFEWCHGITDGRGGLAFFIEILNFYFNAASEEPPKVELNLGLESFYNKEEKGIPQKKQEKGFKANSLPYIKRGYQTDCHILKVDIKDVLRASKRSDASPATILPPLFSRALRENMDSKVKNKNVTCNIVIDARVPMQFQTMHNCIVSKVITYVDRFDTMDFSLVCTIYRALLELAAQKENIVVAATEMVDLVNMLMGIKPKILRRCILLLVAKIMKHSDSNFTFTYLGKLNLEKKVAEGIADFNIRSWTDFGECNIAALDFNGTLILNICENYKNKNIIPTFIRMCKENGMDIEEIKCMEFEQANYRWDS